MSQNTQKKLGDKKSGDELHSSCLKNLHWCLCVCGAIDLILKLEGYKWFCKCCDDDMTKEQAVMIKLVAM